MIETLLSLPELRGKGCGCKSKVIGLLRDDPTFPKPARIGSSLRWRESEIDAWLDAQFDART
jgi:predicted DNA-binding transcriptional regulator AlpA